MSDSEQSAADHLRGGDGILEWPDAADGFSAGGDWARNSHLEIVSAGFLKAAIRRSAMFCGAMAIIGLLVGIGLYKAFPATYQASTTLVLTEGPYENGIDSAQDDQTLAQTRTVAALAMHGLGADQSITSFLKAYQVTVESERVLVVTFSARSADQAVRGANAVGAALLQFRAGMLEQQLNQVLASLTQQVGLAEQRADSINAQISQVSAEPTSPQQQAHLRSLQTQRAAATEAITNLQQAVTSDQASAGPETMAAIKGSRALDTAAPLSRSRLKRVLLYSVAGLIAGLVLGIAIVLVRAILSDRPRRRGDIADALHTPVVLSTGELRTRRWPSPVSLLPRRAAARAAARGAEVERIVTQLRRTVRPCDRGAAVLAVVAIDDPEAAALPVVSLATSQAQQGLRVVVADLAHGAPAARLLGSGTPGVSVAAQVAGLAVAVPEHGDVAPQGPLGHSQQPHDQSSSFTDAVVTAYSRADLLLTLVSLDPWSGGDHLRTWGDEAVVILTAGRSSWTKINAIGELIRLSGTRLLSAILVGSDRSDESLGVTFRHQFDQAADIISGTAEVTRRPEGPENSGRPDGIGRVRLLDDPRRKHSSASRDDLPE